MGALPPMPLHVADQLPAGIDFALILKNQTSSCNQEVAELSGRTSPADRGRPDSAPDSADRSAGLLASVN